jgi:hypothetical protein
MSYSAWKREALLSGSLVMYEGYRGCVTPDERILANLEDERMPGPDA